MTDCSAALRIPALPAESPAAPTPPEMRFVLLPHQQRALYRCLLIEHDGALAKEFNVLGTGYGSYKSRGGVLADAVGMGKTAIALALVLSGEGDGPTLVVAPSHLIKQWQSEISKFHGDALPVIVGLASYEAADPSSLRRGRTIVLIDAKEVLSGRRVWYNFRRVFKEKIPKVDFSSKQWKKKAPPEPPGRIFPAPARMEQFIKAAQ